MENLRLTLIFFVFTMEKINGPFEELDPVSTESTISLGMFIHEQMDHLRPWSEFFNLKAFPLFRMDAHPSSSLETTDQESYRQTTAFLSPSWRKAAIQKMTSNFNYYSSNYFLIPIVLCLLTLL
jgi:hypothetical protein